MVEYEKILHELRTEPESKWELLRQITTSDCKPIKSVENLPKALALIHPDLREVDPPFDNGFYNRGQTKCEIGKLLAVPDHECRFSEDTEDCDHLWPQSLGGPTMPENRRVICSHHNRAKSNSVILYTWEWTDWLESMIHTFASL